MIREEKSLRMTLAAEAAAPTAMNVSTPTGHQMRRTSTMVFFLWPRRRPSRNAITTTATPATTRPVLAAPSATSAVSSATPRISASFASMSARVTVP